MTRHRATVPLRRLLLLSLLTLAPLGAGARADTFGEKVMAPGLLTELPPEAPLRFRHDRALPEAGANAPPPAGGYRRLGPLAGGEVTLRAAPEGKLALEEDGRPLAEFPRSSPHPVLLMFLENVMRGVAQETGGSPHYIRNRMRMTLGAAPLDSAALRIAPFAEDPNRNRFGDFADLEIEIRWQPGAPGRLTLLSANLPGAPERYSETFRAQ